MKICIPTYNRPEIKTLSILNAFNKEDVFIFPNNYNEKLKDEINKLKLKYPNYNIIGLKTNGIGEARNSILNYFNIGDRILMLDDDIEKIYKLGINKNTMKKELIEIDSEEFKKFCDYAFNFTENNNTKLWGVYPVCNPFFMDNSVNNKGFIIGTMTGVIISQLKYKPEFSFKEDYEFTLQHILTYKKVVRFNYITIKAGHYSNPGGVCQQREENPEREKLVCNKLLATYPRYLRRNSKRENEIFINL